MAHWSERDVPLALEQIRVASINNLKEISPGKDRVYLLWFPFPRTQQDAQNSSSVYSKLADFCTTLGENSTVCFLTTPEDAALLLSKVTASLTFQHWVAIKTPARAYQVEDGELPRRHAALLILTRYRGVLRHTRTRIKYTYCPACEKTTKDYGGKTHIYHEYGTAVSDVWRDVECEPSQNIRTVTDRLRDLFAVDGYADLRVIDLHECADLIAKPAMQSVNGPGGSTGGNKKLKKLRSRLVHGDCLESLRAIPSNSIDFCFADLPYNLKKKYCRSKDDLEIVEYFEWCDAWLAEMFRVLKPGGTLAVLNMPLWSARHCEYLSSIMTFRCWIVWEALSIPVRNIMPAHYAILCFSKGTRVKLPGLTVPAASEREHLSPQEEAFCIRPSCYTQRRLLNICDRTEITDIWHDIHRLKHNTRRVNHPCQLPPLLMKRLFSLFTLKGDLILDCFDGAGTSTLVAAQMGRRYIGIERSKRYHNLARKRHSELREGLDPFAKRNGIPKSKNNSVRRIPSRDYEVTKKDLQLEVKRIYQKLGRLPTRNDVARYSNHPIRYFSEYFSSWTEVCAAARTTGMSEILTSAREQQSLNGS